MTNKEIRPRLLVIDDEERVREDLCAIFGAWKYDVQIATGFGPALLEDAKSKAGKFRPHVVIVDLRLLLNDDPNDRSGIKLVEELGPARCILYSAYISHEISRKLAEFKAAGWIGKEEHPNELVQLVHDVAARSSASQSNFRIDTNSIDFDKETHAILGKDTDTPPFFIQDILNQVFQDESGVKIEMIPGAVKTPMSVNRGHSLILKAKRDEKLEPTVVKLAKKRDILREHQNYKKHIEGNLMGGFYAHLLGEPTIFWDVGAVVYSFIGSSGQNVVFSTYYQMEDDSAKILKPLETFFGEVWHGLYSRETGEIKTSLYSSYDEFLKLKERLANFPEQMEQRAFRGINMNMLNPVTWVLKHAGDSSTLSARQAVTHGDLHGDNIFVDGTHAWVIDFERSGWGHILRDFTELEVDILTRLAWKKDENDLREFFYLLTCLVDPRYASEDFDRINQLKNKEFIKAFHVIKGLRYLASDITKFSDFREYIWSLLFDSVFVAAYNPEDDPQRERSLLYGSVLCSRLQHWGMEWPPDDWKPALASIQAPAEINPVKIDSPASQGNNTTMQENSAQTDKNVARVPSSQIINVIGGSIVFIVVAGIIIAFLQKMNSLNTTWQQILAVFIFLSILAIMAFTLLGLIKGRDALSAITKMFSTLFGREGTFSNKESSSSGDNNDGKFRG